MPVRRNAASLRILSIVSKNQNKLRKCWIYVFILKTEIIEKVELPV